MAEVYPYTPVTDQPGGGWLWSWTGSYYWSSRLAHSRATRESACFSGGIVAQPCWDT
jgi:hypothetical protein